MKYIEVPNSPQVQQASTGVQMDPGAAAAPWRGVQAAGQAISESGQYFGLYAQKKQEADDFAGLTQFENQIEATKREVQAAIAAEPDETKWGEILEQSFSGVKFEGKGVSNQARAKADMILMGELEKERTTVQTQFLKADARRKGAIYDSAIEMAVEDGDMEKVNAKLAEAERLGIFGPETVQAKRAAAEERVDYYEAAALMETDPKAAEELLSEQTEGGRFRNFKNLSPQSRQTLRGRASQMGIDEQKEFYTELIKQAEMGEFVHSDKLKVWMDEGRLSPWHAKQYRETYLGKTPQNLDQKRYAALNREIDNYDPKTDESWEEYSRILGSFIGMPSSALGDLHRRLEAKRNPASPENSEILRTGRDTIEKLFSSGFLGNTSTLMGDEPDDPKAYQLAMTKRSRLRDELNRFMDRNPGATHVEVNSFLNSLVQTDRDVQAISILNNTPTATKKPSGGDLDAILKANGLKLE